MTMFVEAARLMITATLNNPRAWTRWNHPARSRKIPQPRGICRRADVPAPEGSTYLRRFAGTPVAETGGKHIEEQMMTTRPGIAQWMQLIQAEYNEMPGLHLTKPQVRRLWGLDQVTCDALLDALQDVGFLRRTRANGYARTDFGC